MIINRVFCYSKEVALKNGNKLPIAQLVVTIILGVVIILGASIIMGQDFNAVMLIGSLSIWLVMMIYFGISIGNKLRVKMTGYATDTNGRLYKAAVINSASLYVGGVYIGDLIDQLAGNNSDLGGALGEIGGAAAQFYLMDKAGEYMSNPEVVAKIIEDYANVQGAEVYEFIKVHSITEKRKKIIVNCDYKILKSNKTKYAKNITIEKSFNMFEDLMGVLNTLK